ncbi:MAG: NADH-quinone oxidoreductase subunit J [Aquificaceae bacterium]|nr:NADH-quinone oxidoreductase subunit J [Aquificaceae bacterium]MDW8237231.1 NADH-quinone oxidoreductase subunit J [Aquificaceae bacterium]
MEWLIVIFFGLWAFISTLGVLFLKSPVHAILSFLSVILAVSGMFLHLGAELLAGLQLVIYAVSIVVFYVLVITTIPWEKVKRFGKVNLTQLLLATPVLILSTLITSSAIFEVEFKDSPPPSLESVGKSLFSSYLLPLEVASILLLVAMVGAIAIGRKDA